MEEKILTFIWSHRYFPTRVSTVDGKDVKILDYGIPSIDSGPDFINVRAVIDGKLWVGAVEMHVKASDWYVHKHDQDSAFQCVILHIVMLADKPVYRQTGELLPTVEYKPSDSLLDVYHSLVNKSDIIKCDKYLTSIPSAVASSWMDRLVFQRLESRSNHILEIYQNKEKEWEQVIFQMIARAMGARLNSEPMEILASSLSYKILKRYSDQQEILEAIFFGQAGFLDDSLDDDYFQRLKQLFQHYKYIHSLRPLEKHIWKFLRSRPYNFPTIRISQLANLIATSSHLFSQILEIDVKNVSALFRLRASSYWDNHFRFGVQSPYKVKFLGEFTVNNILINAVVPVLFAYGYNQGDNSLINKAIDILTSLKFERNRVTKLFTNLRLRYPTAADSQALLELYENYCQRGRCLDCHIGTYIMSRGIR